MTTTAAFEAPPKRDDTVVYGSLAAVATIGLLVVFFGMSAETFLYLSVLTIPVLFGARLLLKYDTTMWLGKIVFYGWLAKLLGSAFRGYVALVLYGGRADAVGYYNSATFHVHEWREFIVPTITARSAGTNFTESITGFFFIPFVPDILGGFFLFAMLAFLGQMMFYAAFRKAIPAAGHKRYALAIFLLPSMVYWPSSIGKDALITFGIGMAAWGAASMFKGEWGNGIMGAGAGLLLAASIRPHVAALFFAATSVALLVSRAPTIKGGQFLRIVLLVVMGVGLSLAAVRLSASYNVGLTAEGFEGFASEVARRTSQGGSQVTGQPVSSLADIPEATLRVLYRPLLHEANSIQVLLSAIEGTFLLGLTIIALPRILGNLWAGRRHQYVALALAYTFGFVIAFSSFFNLGIIARQRVQVLPLLMAWLVALTLRREELFEQEELEPIVVVERRSVGAGR